jgi:hypothetical protein
VRPLRSRLEEARGKTGLPWEVIERDYLLSWVLAGIQEVAALRETLVFKRSPGSSFGSLDSRPP